MRKQKPSAAVRSRRHKKPIEREESLPAGSNQPLPLPTSVAEAARQRMVAEAAYYRAEKRGFAPGQELDDWLAAEAEIAQYFLEQQPTASDLH